MIIMVRDGLELRIHQFLSIENISRLNPPPAISPTKQHDETKAKRVLDILFKVVDDHPTRKQLQQPNKIEQHTHTHTHIYTYIHTHTRTRTYTYTYTYT